MREHDQRIVWTPADDAQLRRLKAESVPAIEIAARLGRTQASVYRRWNRLRAREKGTTEASVPKGPTYGTAWSADEHARLVALIAGGHSARTAAIELGRTYLAVTRQMSMRGLRTARSIDEASIEAIVYRATQRWRPSRIARQVGVGIHVVEAVLRQHHGQSA